MLSQFRKPGGFANYGIAFCEGGEMSGPTLMPDFPLSIGKY